jgi:F-type H+-transporting ATPase subunit gamma
MASRQQIKRRIGSVKSTKQITKAMQLVAASKLRRAQDAAVGPQAYAQMARQILARLRQLASDDSQFKLFTERPIKRRLLVLVTSDRTLAGAYNANVIRRMISEVKQDRERGQQTSVICLGKQGANAASRISDLEVEAIYAGLPDKPDADALRPILNTIVNLFVDGTVDAVDLINTHYVSTVVQTVELRRLLPAGDNADDNDRNEPDQVPAALAHAEAEPSVEVLVQATTARLLEAQIYQAFLDAVASEHSMRMLAMKNATDNASDIIDDLTLVYNNARQAAITQELAEITGGAEAMK